MNGKRFHYLVDGKPVGPVPFAELRQRAEGNLLKPTDMVWPEGAPNWIPASQVEGLFAPAPPAAAPPTPAAPATPPAPAPGAPRTNRDALLDAAMAGFESGMSGGAPKPAGPDFMTKAKTVFAFLTSSLPGAAGLAFVGLLFMCCGGCGAFMSFNSESAPTKVAIADLEKDSKAPPANWLEITDGHIFWGEMVSDILTKKKGDQETKTTNWYYVPLVSKEVKEDWSKELINSVSSRRKSEFSYAKARVYLKISPAQMKKDFPDAIGDDKSKVTMSTEKSPVKGTVGKFKSIPDHVMPGLKANAKDQNIDRMILVNYGDEVPSTGVGICVAIFLWIFALPWFAPLVIVLLKRLKKPATPATPATPA